MPNSPLPQTVCNSCNMSQTKTKKVEQTGCIHCGAWPFVGRDPSPGALPPTSRPPSGCPLGVRTTF